MEIMDIQETCEDGQPEYRRVHERDCEITANAWLQGRTSGIRYYGTLLLLMLAGY